MTHAPFIPMTGPAIETERLTLRLPREEDGASYVAFFQTARSQYMGGPWDTFEAWKGWYTELGHWALRGYGMFAVTLKGEDRSIGQVGPWSPHTWPGREIGWLLYEAADEGKGYAREAAEAARDYARTALGWTGMVSFIHRDNAPSIRLAERMGAWHDADAPCPDGYDLAYRHPDPEAA